MKINMGVLQLLGVAFVVLKLAGVIAWPWVLVLAPFIASALMLGILIIVWGVILAVYGGR